MTAASEFNPETDQQEREYPTAFGITFTPDVSGILLGALGVLLGGYLWYQYVRPAGESLNRLRADRDALQAQIDNQPDLQALQEEIEAQLQQARDRQAQVLSLLSSEDSLDTLLVDLERLVADANSQIGGGNLDLREFTPVDQRAVVVTDGSFGADVNNQVKRQRFTLSLAGGTFAQNASLVNELERLQPLLIVRSFETSIVAGQTVDYQPAGNNFVATRPPRLQTSLAVEAVLPAEEN